MVTSPRRCGPGRLNPKSWICSARASAAAALTTRASGSQIEPCLAIKPVEPKSHGRPVKGPFVFDHVSFGVDSADALWELKDKLEAAGFEPSDVIDHGFIHSIYAFDPNGIPIEFSWIVEGRNIHDEPVMGDTELTTLAKEGPEPQPNRWRAVKNPTPPSERRIYAGAGSELYHGKKKQ
ncbi:MAG: VOC family protein [Planctomycetota bacterium]